VVARIDRDERSWAPLEEEGREPWNKAHPRRIPLTVSSCTLRRRLWTLVLGLRVSREGLMAARESMNGLARPSAEAQEQQG